MAKKTPANEKAETSRKTTDKFNYVLDWIQEANDARRAQNKLVERTILAYQGIPSRNTYKDTIDKYAELIYRDDSERSKAIKAAYEKFEAKRNYVVHNGIETIVSMAMGGVGQYEFGPYDPELKKDKKVLDQLASAAKHFYDTEHMDSIVPQFIRNAPLRGTSHIHIKPKNGKKQVTILTTDQMLTDPKRFKINRERFIGFSQRESFRAVKNRITKTASGYKLKTLNDAQVYVEQIRNELNGINSGSTPTSAKSLLHDELRRDLDIFYAPLVARITTNKENNPEYTYDGDEIEMSYMYDLYKDMYFEIVNRKYVVVAKPSELKRDIKCSYIDSKGEEKPKTKEVKLDHPFVELPYIKTDWDKYPITPLFYALDDFDKLCAMETLLDHTLSIMGPLTFVAQSADAEKLSRLAQVSGEVAEGVPATVGILNKTHDITPIVTAIERTEEKIKRIMKAVDPFELQAMIGDRASAKEVASASGQVAQGINPFIANIETAMSEIGNKFIKMELIFGKDEYSFNHNGEYASLTAEEMAGDYEIRAKLVTSIKLEQAQNARAALELIGVLGANEAIDKKQFLGTMIPIALSSIVSREQAEAMVLPAYRPMPEEVIERIKKQAEEDAKRNPVEKLDFTQYSDADLDEMLTNMATTGDVTGEGDLAETMPIIEGQPLPAGVPVDIPVQQDPLAELPVGQNTGLPPGTAPTSIPLTPETGGMYANDPTLVGQPYA